MTKLFGPGRVFLWLLWISQRHPGSIVFKFSLPFFMSVKSSIKERDCTYFITITCLNLLPLFKLTNSYDAVYKWFDYLKSKGHYINGYVIMPNHLHVLFGFRCAIKASILLLAMVKSLWLMKY